MTMQVRWGALAACRNIGALALLVVSGCQTRTPLSSSRGSAPLPALAQPVGPPTNFHSITPPRVFDLTDGGPAIGVTAATIIDTRTFPQQIQDRGPFEAKLRNKNYLPATEAEEEEEMPTPRGVPNSLVAARSVGVHRARPGPSFPGITQTGWVPPDPTLAVGPNHIVTTVNQAIAFLTKSGTLTFQAQLNVTGNPGFFEDVGAGGFTFDPKCFYDHDAGRFVVVAPETYGDNEAWITIAVSDDSDPNGIWYKYRTDAVVQVGDTTFWWDYPGFGYDHDAYYFTGNLFGLNQSGFGGAGFRVFHKAPMLVGDPVVHATLRAQNSSTVQVAQHFGSPQAPYFVSTASSTSLRIHAITNPLTNPQLVGVTVPVPGFSSPPAPPVAGGSTIGLTGSGILNAQWRDGSLYATHHVGSNGKSVARWYEIATNNWPASGAPSLVQSGDVDPGADVHAWFPAIYSNANGELGMVVGTSSPSQRMAVAVTGRTSFDAPGVMGAVEQVTISGRNGGGRKGDYYDIAIDPNDDLTFWLIGETFENFGWSTWISSFMVADPTRPRVIDDVIPLALGAQPAILDVLANDYHPGGLDFGISAFDPVSAHGGAVALSAGSGPGGRDQLIYTPPTDYSGPDLFSYVAQDTGGGIAVGDVTVGVYQLADFRTPENPYAVRFGLDARYYALSSPTSLPDFDALTPIGTGVLTLLNSPSGPGAPLGAPLTDNVGARIDGYFDAPALDVYTFHITSDDGSRLWIGDQLVVDNDGLHGMTEASGSIPLRPGRHAMRIDYFEAGSTAGLIAEVESTGSANVVIPQEDLLRVNPCPADLIFPEGVLNFSDVNVFLLRFAQQEAPADLAVPFGVWDFNDVLAYLIAFAAGCP
ncbi:MAG: PA14 domain-containing protein [Phycisphaerales bacterium]